jgi:hypothetical protein
MVPNKRNLSAKKEFRSLVFRFKNGQKMSQNGDQPNKAVIAKFDKSYKKFLPQVALKKFKAKMKEIKSTIKEEKEILTLKLTKMHRIQCESQEKLKLRIQKLENAYIRLRDTTRNMKNRMFHLAKSSRASDKDSKTAIDNIFEIKDEISNCADQREISQTVVKLMKFSEFAGFDKPIIPSAMTSSENKIKESNAHSLNKFMLFCLHTMETELVVDKDELYEEVLAQFEESEELELGKFNGPRSVREGGGQVILPTGGRYNPYPNHSHRLSQDHLT